MKPLLFLMLSALLGCTAEKQIQATMVDATLVKIEVLKRYPNVIEKLLTWKTSKNVIYVTVEPESTDLAIGTSTKVLIQK